MPDENLISNKARSSSPNQEAPSKAQIAEGALAASTAKLDTFSKKIEEGVTKTEEATNAISSSIAEVNLADSIASLASDNADLKAQEARQRLFEASGGIEKQIQLMTRLNSEGDRVSELLAKQADMMDDEHTGVWIVDHIMNDIKSTQTKIDLNIARQQQAQTTAQIQAMTGSQEGFIRINELTKETMNAATMEAKQKRIAAMGKIAASESEIKNAQSNATAMSTLMTSDSRSVDNTLQSFRLQGEIANRELRAEQQVIERESMTFQREQWKIQLPAAKIALEAATIALEDTKNVTPERRLAQEANFKSATKNFNDQVATEDQLVAAVQKGQSLAGVTIEPRETIVRGLSRGGETGAKYERLHEIGGSDAGQIGLTPFDASANLKTISPEGNIKQTKGTKLLNEAMSLQLAEYTKAGSAGIPKSEETLKEDFNKTATGLAKLYEAEIKEGDASNPYAAPPMTVLAAIPAVSSEPLYKKVLGPLSMKETSPQKIMDATIAAIQSKLVTPEEAASGITAIFKAAAAYNNTQEGGFVRVGLPPQTEFNVKLSRVPTTFEISKALPALSNPFTLPGRVDKSDAANFGQFLEQQVNAWVTADLTDTTSVQFAIVSILKTAQAPVPTTPAPQPITTP